MRGGLSSRRVIIHVTTLNSAVSASNRIRISVRNGYKLARQSRLQLENQQGFIDARVKKRRFCSRIRTQPSDNSYNVPFMEERATTHCLQELAVKRTLAVGLLGLAIAGGCSNAKKTTESSVTEPLTPAPVAYQPAPQPYTPSPVAAQPVTYDSTPAPMAASAAPAVSGGSYTVKKGDTLYGIAKSRYGSGKEYTKIVAANPGLSPQTLKVGQTITIP